MIASFLALKRTSQIRPPTSIGRLVANNAAGSPALEASGEASSRSSLSKSSRSSRIAAEGQFVARQGLEVAQDKIFGPISGGLDSKVGVSPRVKAGVVPYSSLETSLGFVRNVFGVVEALESRIAVRQVESRDVAAEFRAGDRIGGVEQRTESVKYVGVGLDARLNHVLRIARLALETQLRLAPDVVLDNKVQQY